MMRRTCKKREFEKRPGPDWVVEVMLIDEDEVYPVTIFGAKDEAEAVREALWSFHIHYKPDEMKVISVVAIEGGWAGQS